VPFPFYNLSFVVGEIGRDIDGFREKLYDGPLFLFFFLAECEFCLVTNFHGFLLKFLVFQFFLRARILWVEGLTAGGAMQEELCK
jgi:hypothetical protein